MEPLRIGIIGLGAVADVHLLAYKSVKSVKVIAGSDISQTRLDEMVKSWKINGYTDYLEMLKNEELDLIVVCVPCRYHREVVERVAEFKIPILVEKPLATTLTEAKSMIAKCKQNNVPLAYGASYRWLPANMKAKDIIKEGILGNISLLIEMAIGGHGIEKFQDLGQHHYPLGMPGGSGMGIVDHGIHLIDLFRWFLDSEVVSVYGNGNYSGGIPSSEHVTMKFMNGATAHLIYNEISYYSDLKSEGIYSWGGAWRPDGSLNLSGGWEDHPGNIRIHGEKGAIRIFYYANKIFLSNESGQKPISLLSRPMPGNFALQIESFANSIINQTPLAVPAEEGLKALEILEAVYKSQKTQSLIKL